MLNSGPSLCESFQCTVAFFPHLRRRLSLYIRHKNGIMKRFAPVKRQYSGTGDDANGTDSNSEGKFPFPHYSNESTKLFNDQSNCIRKHHVNYQVETKLIHSISAYNMQGYLLCVKSVIRSTAIMLCCSFTELFSKLILISVIVSLCFARTDHHDG